MLVHKTTPNSAKYKSHKYTGIPKANNEMIFKDKENEAKVKKGEFMTLHRTKWNPINIYFMRQRGTINQV